MTRFLLIIAFVSVVNCADNELLLLGEERPSLKIYVTKHELEAEQKALLAADSGKRASNAWTAAKALVSWQLTADPRIRTIIMPDGRTVDGRLVSDYCPNLTMVNALDVEKNPLISQWYYRLRISTDTETHYELLQTLVNSATEGNALALGFLGYMYYADYKNSHKIAWTYHDPIRAKWFRTAYNLRKSIADTKTDESEKKAAAEVLQSMLSAINA